MPAPETTSVPYPGAWKRPPVFFTNTTVRYGFWLLIGFYLIWSTGTLDIDWPRAARGLPRAGDMIARMFPPDFSRSTLLIKGIIESL